MNAIWLLTGAIGTGTIVWLVMRSRLAQAQTELTTARETGEKACETIGERDRQLAERDRQLAEVRGSLETQVARLETELKAARDGSEEKLHLLEETKASMTQAIKASCVDAFKEGNAQVVELAQARFRAERAESKREIAQMVKPVEEGLTAFKQRLDEIERAQIEGRAEVQEQLGTLGQLQQQMIAGTDALVGALRRPHVRGRWGEMTLKRVIETAGMLPHVDYSEQPTLNGEDGPRRPDVIVHIPGEKQVVVDSKVPLEAYLDACAATDEDERRRHLQTHAQQLRQHIRKLGSKAYWQESTTMPDFVFLFVPNDQVLAAAAEVDAELMGEVEKNRVFLATPMTLMVLLRVVAVGWQQEKVAESARLIWKLGRDLHRRLGKLGERLQTLGRRLGSAVKAFNELVGTYDTRVLPGARRFAELGPVSPADTLPAPDEILEVPRTVQAPEVIEGESGDSTDEGDDEQAAGDAAA